MNQGQNNTAKPQAPVVNWPLILCLSAALPIELLLHDLRTFGVRSISPRAVAALLLMFLFAGFHPNENCVPLSALWSQQLCLAWWRKSSPRFDSGADNRFIPDTAAGRIWRS